MFQLVYMYVVPFWLKISSLGYHAPSNQATKSFIGKLFFVLCSDVLAMKNGLHRMTFYFDKPVIYQHETFTEVSYPSSVILHLNQEVGIDSLVNYFLLHPSYVIYC